MQGLRWVIDMYRSGVCGDYRYVYERFPPTVDSLLDELAAGSSCTEQLAPAELAAGPGYPATVWTGYLRRDCHVLSVC